MNAQDTKTELLARLEDLQRWFAGKPYGFTETCSPDRLQQYRDREREQDAILWRLERIGRDAAQARKARGELPGFMKAKKAK